MKKVMFFCDKISYSGASKIIAWLANNISLPDTELSLITYLPVEDQREIKGSVKRIKLNVACGNKLSRAHNIISLLRKLVKKDNYDLCISFLPIESMYARLALFGLHTKLIVCERSDPYLEKSIFANMGRYLYRFADGAVFQTNEARDYFGKKLRDTSVVIPNPAFNVESRFIPYHMRSDSIAYSGRLYNKQKRLDVLIDAFFEVAKTNNHTNLYIYGDGPDMQSLKKLVCERKLDKRVFFMGNVKNILEEISKHKLLVLTSDYEGIPNVIIEALQCGVPVVSTDCSPGGARVLLNNAQNGYVVSRGDVKQLSERINEILSDTSKGETMAKEALEITKRFKEDVIISEWEKYICSYLI